MTCDECPKGECDDCEDCRWMRDSWPAEVIDLRHLGVQGAIAASFDMMRAVLGLTDSRSPDVTIEYAWDRGSERLYETRDGGVSSGYRGSSPQWVAPELVELDDIPLHPPPSPTPPSPVNEGDARMNEPRTHSLVDRILGRHKWVIQPSSFYHFRGGGTAVFEYECWCGALREAVWPGEHAAGRRMTAEEKAAVGPYL